MPRGIPGSGKAAIPAVPAATVTAQGTKGVKLKRKVGRRAIETITIKEHEKLTKELLTSTTDTLLHNVASDAVLIENALQESHYGPATSRLVSRYLALLRDGILNDK